MKLPKIILSFVMLAVGFIAMGQNADRIGIRGISIERRGGSAVAIAMTVDPSTVKLRRDQLLRVAPVLKSADGADSIALPAFMIAGRNQYYYTLRNDKADCQLYHSGDKDAGAYAVDTPWQDWMADSRLDFSVKTSACCGEPVAEESIPVAVLDYTEPVVDLDFLYVEPVAVGDKTFKIEGSAYVNFPVNRTEIYPDYMNNAVELGKITASVDSVRENPDATIQGVTLTGYASPEGPYANNVRLAKGRTEAVRDYVSRLYDFPSTVYHSSSVPEDWAGLRKAVEKSSLENHQAIIEFIDSDYPIEKRNDRLRRLFPADYAWLLKNVYPGLRHTDYLVNYTVRRYADVEEIKRVMKTRPQNLSPNELYLVAQSYPVGSKEYNEVFDIAVRLFPDNPVANLNAANAAMSRGDLKSASSFLEKSGDSPQADYARGIFHAKKKDYDKALEYFGKSNSENGRFAIEKIKTIKKHHGGVRYLP